MLTDVVKVTLVLGTVAVVTVTVGVARDRHSQAVDMRGHAKGTGAPAQSLDAWLVAVDGLVGVVNLTVVLQEVSPLSGGGGWGGAG
jgi:hypothetical protein